MRRLTLGLILPTFVLALSACDKPVAPTATIEERFPITVEQRVTYLEIALSPDGAPRPLEQAELRAFIADWMAGGLGALTLSAPSSTVEKRTLAAVRAAMADLGADGRQLRSSRPTGTPGSALLAYERLVAVPPDCAVEHGDYAVDNKTRNLAFGCATRRNLAMMVANPADLIAPATPGGGPFAARRSLVIRNWRKGEVTPAKTPEAELRTVDFLSQVLGSR